MIKFSVKALWVLSFSVLSFNAMAAQECKVSMMGRVCYEEGSPEATAAHMKGDAVKEAQASKKIEIADAKDAKDAKK